MNKHNNLIYTDLSDKDFADAFSQIISFSLLFYRLNKRKNVDLNSFNDMPEYIPIFREFLSRIDFNIFNIKEVDVCIAFFVKTGGRKIKKSLRGLKKSELKSTVGEQFQK